MSFPKVCPRCGKNLKQATLRGGKRALICKTPTCKNYGKAVR
jgi:hypothetical protein